MIGVTAAVQAATEVTYEGRWSLALTPPGGVAVSVPVTNGKCSKNNEGSPRTQVEVDTPAELFPTVPAPHLLPFGTRAVLQWTIQATTYTIATGPLLGSTLRRPEGMWRLRIGDDAELVANDRVPPGGFTWNPGETVEALITRLVQRTIPGVPVTASGDATTDLVDAEMEPKPEDGAFDPWKLASAAAAGSGAECFFDANGGLVIRDLPDLGTPVDTLTTAKHILGHSLLFERAVSRTIIVWLDRDQSPPTVSRTGIWDDTRPTSPTRQDLIGRVAITRTQDGNPGQVKADRAARRWARKVAGYARNLEIDTVARPWLEPGDTITVVLADGQSEDHLIQRIEMPLSAGPTSIRCMDSQYDTTTPV